MRGQVVVEVAIEVVHQELITCSWIFSLLVRNISAYLAGIEGLTGVECLIESACCSVWFKFQPKKPVFHYFTLWTAFDRHTCILLWLW